MKADVQTMDFRVMLPGHPEVRAWFMGKWSVRGANRGIRKHRAVVPNWDNVRGLVVVVVDDRGQRIGMVLFEEINPAEVVVHTALRTFGSRTDHAFLMACQKAREWHYERFYYAFSTGNRSAYGVMQRCHLLTDSVSVRPEWALVPWIFGSFV